MDSTTLNPIETWIARVAPGNSFVDIGGIGENSLNERATFARRAGATRVAMADIIPFSHPLWEPFRAKTAALGLTDIATIEDVDIRSVKSLRQVGRTDVVHSTGIFYHLPSPPDALWALRTIVGKYLITNTVMFPGHVSNEYGSVSLPDCGVLFLPSMSTTERLVLGKYYRDRFGFEVDQMSPRLDDRDRPNQWVDGEELACWPNWWFYTDQAFRALLNLCRFEVLEEYKWEDHALHVLCRPVD